MLDKEIMRLEDKKFLANKANRAENTDKIVKKLDELKPIAETTGKMTAFLEQMKGEKGDTGGQGEQGIQGEQGLQGDKGEIGGKGDKGEKGDKGDKGEPGIDGKNGGTGLRGEKGSNGKDGSPDTAKQIVEKLQTIKDAWLELSQIKGLQELISETGTNVLQQARGFVPNALASLYDVDVRTITDQQSLVWDSVKRKFVPGTPATGGGTGFTKETPTGTVDGANQTFTVTHTPNYIVSDGITMFDGAGYTIVGLTLTLTVPPQEYIRSYY